jgi:serine/threonine protein phosphatase PrpC
MMQLELATAEYIGARAQQQDLAAAISLKSGAALLVLADGLGGHESGAEASRIVVDTFREAAGHSLFDDPATRRDVLRETIERANARIGQGVDPAHGHRGMASTAVAALVSDGELRWVSVGDSHLYVWRGGRLAKLNEDHSQAGLMIRSGQYKPDDPEVQSVKSVLVSALTGRKLEIVDLPERTFKVESGDVLMLASDGLNSLDDEEIGQIVAERHSEGAVRLSTVLLETVRSRRLERQDNTTVAVARVLATAVRPAAAELAMRTVTHQVTVPTEIATESKTERVAEGELTAEALATATDAAVTPTTRPAPVDVAEAMAKAARGEATKEEKKSVLETSTLRTDPLPATSERPRLEAQLADAQKDPVAGDKTMTDAPLQARKSAPPKTRRSLGSALLGILLLLLAAAIAAIGVASAFDVPWLSNLLSGSAGTTSPSPKTLAVPKSSAPAAAKVTPPPKETAPPQPLPRQVNPPADAANGPASPSPASQTPGGDQPAATQAQPTDPPLTGPVEEAPKIKDGPRPAPRN